VRELTAVDSATKDAAQEEIREAVRELCSRFPSPYWREIDELRRYPEAFVQALTDAGWLSMLIPEQYGGGGRPLSEASIVLEEINASGGNAAACHAQMYTMGVLLRHGTEEQQERYLGDIASGKLRLQAFAISEPDSGSDMTRIATKAVRMGDHYVVSGQKIFTSRVQHSDLMLLIARTEARGSDDNRAQGLSLFIVDLREAGDAIEVRPIKVMFNHETNQVFLRDLKVPVDGLIGQEGQGFRYVLDGLNAERILLAAECVGDGRWFCQMGAAYASQRVVFGRPIGQNQAVQFPLARAYAKVRAADLMRKQAALLFDSSLPCGPEANMAKLLASEAAWEAANACMDAFGGYGFTAEYDIERKFRETRLYQAAPIGNNLVLAYLGHNVLGMPRSY
jgi:acyl-CoA dehydrogenase